MIKSLLALVGISGMGYGVYRAQRGYQYPAPLVTDPQITGGDSQQQGPRYIVTIEDVPTVDPDAPGRAPVANRYTSNTGYQLIRDREGERLVAYWDDAGQVWTIGYGHTRTAREGMTITPATAEALLRGDVAEKERDVKRLVKVPVTQGEFDALVSFTFNLGAGALADSTLLRKLNAGDYTGAAGEFPRWVYAGGRKLAGLVARRQDEQGLFLYGEYA